MIGPLALYGVRRYLANAREREGLSCTGEKSKCLDGTTMLICSDSKWRKVPCNGPKQCAGDQEHALCDESGNSAGDACWEDKTSLCSTDSKAMLSCVDHKVTRLECLGASGCTSDSAKVHCDLSVSTVGAPCDNPKNAACSADGKSKLNCTNGHLEVGSLCSDGCKVEHDTVYCDGSSGKVGDPCADGATVCTIDHKSLLKCQGSHWAFGDHCRGAEGCKTTRDKWSCDSSVAEVGESCTDGAACSVDGKAMLVCENQKLVVKHKCNCELTSDDKVRCK